MAFNSSLHDDGEQAVCSSRNSSNVFLATYLMVFLKSSYGVPCKEETGEVSVWPLHQLYNS